MPHCNTTAYWNRIWGHYRHDDKQSYIRAVAKNSLTQEYWDDAFKNPIEKVKYSVQRAWWYAREYDMKSILDVGCGNGRLLYGMKIAVPHADLYGVDFSETAINRMKKEYGVDGEVLNIYDMGEIKKTFNMVVANDVLEHVEDDDEFIQSCKNMLSDDGILYLGIPNDILGPDETDEHLRKYTEESVRSLIEKFFDIYWIEIIDIHILCIAKKVKTI